MSRKSKLGSTILSLVVGFLWFSVADGQDTKVQQSDKLKGTVDSSNSKSDALAKGNKQDEQDAYADLPVGLTSFGAAICNDYLYAYGGNKGGSRSFSKENHNHIFYRLHLDGKSEWEDLGTFPGRQGMPMVAHDGKLYRLGGFEASNAKGEKAALTSTADFAVFDPESKKWSDLPPMPVPRSSFDAVVMDGFVYVVGGWALEPETTTLNEDENKDKPDDRWHEVAYRFELGKEGARWEEIANTPFHRRAISLAHRDGKLYCIGGMLKDENMPTTEVAIYDPRSNRWSDGPKIPGTPMDGFGSSSFTVAGNLFVSTFGGQVLRLSKDAKSWVKVHELKNGRFFHRMVGWNDENLVVVGGVKPPKGKVLEIELIEVDQLPADDKSPE